MGKILMIYKTEDGDSRRIYDSFEEWYHGWIDGTIYEEMLNGVDKCVADNFMEFWEINRNVSVKPAKITYEWR
jgi:hypothetical protein